MDEFEYDGRYPETIEVDAITRELDLIIGGLKVITMMGRANCSTRVPTRNTNDVTQSRP